MAQACPRLARRARDAIQQMESAPTVDSKPPAPDPAPPGDDTFDPNTGPEDNSLLGGGDCGAMFDYFVAELNAGRIPQLDFDALTDELATACAHGDL
ncbi:hypothetical protein AB0N29_01800 [Nocardioides sp. NPDC092400]|uniref:hypothetical protein n=1 Tax=Nocardioides sp. NPDC092400 TaxID=3155196 RepID=UPI00341931A4